MEKSKVSVIIPCYNVAEYVEESVRSIMEQTYKNLEIICIDDGSTDSTKEILLGLAREDARVVLSSNEINRGLINTLNNAIDLSTGDFIARMDADDVSNRKRIEKQLFFLQKNNLDICGSYIHLLNSQGQYLNKGRCFISSVCGVQLLSMFDSPIIHPTALAKSSILKENKYSCDANSYVVEDYELWCRLIRKGYRIGVLPERLLYYRLNPNGESFSKRDIQNNNHILVSMLQQCFFLDFTLKKESISLISGKGVNCELLKYLHLKGCLHDIEKITQSFLSHPKLSQCDREDIIRWSHFKKIYVNLIFIKYSTRYFKFISFFILLYYSRYMLDRNIFTSVLSLISKKK